MARIYTAKQRNSVHCNIYHNIALDCTPDMTPSPTDLSDSKSQSLMHTMYTIGTLHVLSSVTEWCVDCFLTMHHLFTQICYRLKWRQLYSTSHLNCTLKCLKEAVTSVLDRDSWFALHGLYCGKARCSSLMKQPPMWTPRKCVSCAGGLSFDQSHGEKTVLYLAYWIL